MGDHWPWPIIKFCCDEIGRQQDHVNTVPDLMRAWEDAIAVAMRPAYAPWGHCQELITMDVLEKWGFLAKPYINCRGFRRHNVQIGDYHPPDHRDVPRLMDQFCRAVREGKFTPAEAYYEYEMIHPFADGNGRTGKILYNFLLGTLLEPQLPPNFFGHENL